MSDSTFPWQCNMLRSWSICGMNHYHVDGERFLFISMVRDEYCITIEGKDNIDLWNLLWDKAAKYE